MLERAQSKPQMNQTLQKRLTCPERVVEELHPINDIITIRIDADVRIPDVDKIPVMRTHAADFSQETVSLLFQRLCGNVNMFKLPSGMTKSEIEEKILDYKRMLSAPDGAYSQEALASYQETLALLEAQYPAAPETLTPVPCNGQLTETTAFLLAS